MKKKYLLNIYFIILLSYNVSSQSIKEIRDSVINYEVIHYDYEKYKDVFDIEMAKLEASGEYKKDTVLVFNKCENISNYFRHSNQPKLRSEGYNLISYGNSKIEIFIHFLMNICSADNRNYISDTIEEKGNSENLTQIESNYFLGKRLVWKYKKSKYFKGKNIESQNQYASIYFMHDSVLYLIRANLKLSKNNFVKTKENTFSIIEISNSDTTILCDNRKGVYTWSDNSDLFFQAFYQYLNDLGIEFKLTDEYGIVSISKKKLKQLQRQDKIKCPTTFPKINIVEELYIEYYNSFENKEGLLDKYYYSLEIIELMRKLKVDYDYEKYQKVFNEEMKKLMDEDEQNQ